MPSIFTQQVIEVIRMIPEGRVSTYGRVARAAGHPLGARQVSWLLHSASQKYHLPWHRVVNAKGRISLPAAGGYELQKSLLESEGVVFSADDTIDLDRFLFEVPGDPYFTDL